MCLFNKIYVCKAMVDTTLDLCQKDEGFFLKKRMKGVFVYVLELMLTFDKMQINSTLMCRTSKSEGRAF